jgi:hypothetical protein
VFLLFGQRNASCRSEERSDEAICLLQMGPEKQEIASQRTLATTWEVVVIFQTLVTDQLVIRIVAFP